MIFANCIIFTKMYFESRNHFIKFLASFHILHCGELLIVTAEHHLRFHPNFSDVIASSANSAPFHRLFRPL